MWVCPSCGSNNELAACWMCRSPRPELAAATPGAPWAAGAEAPGAVGTAPPPPATDPVAAPDGVPPGYPVPYGIPPWAPMPAPRRSSAGRIAAAVAAVVVVAVVAAVVGVTVIGRRLDLTTPASIGGEPRIQSSQTASFGDTTTQRLKDLGAASTVVAVYGGPAAPEHIVIAASGRLEGTDSDFVDGFISGLGTSGASVDRAALTRVTFAGAEYTCGTAAGALSMPFCTWFAGNDGGAVLALPGASGDLLSYTEQARQAVTSH